MVKRFRQFILMSTSRFTAFSTSIFLWIEIAHLALVATHGRDFFLDDAAGINPMIRLIGGKVIKMFDAMRSNVTDKLFRKTPARSGISECVLRTHAHFEVSRLVETYCIALISMELGGMPIDAKMYIKYNLSTDRFSCVYRIFFVVSVDWISQKELSEIA